MGISTLMPSMEKAISAVHIQSLSGRKVGVDVSCLIYKALGAPDNRCDVNQYVFKCVNRLNFHNIHVILVFDGLGPPAKKETLDKRKRAREKKKADKMEEKDLKKLCTRSGELQESLKRFCQLHQIPYVEAASEADAQLAYMIRKGEVDLILTEDSDLIVYGCPEILFKYRQGQGKLFQQSKFDRCWNAPFKMDTFRAVCTLLGSDYLVGGLYQFGIEKAKELYPKLKSPLNYSQMHSLISVDIPKGFKAKFDRAINTFLYQPVYDVMTKSCIPLTPYPEGKSEIDYPYAGNPNSAKGYHWYPPESEETPGPSGNKATPQITPYACTQCDQVFKHKNQRINHEKEFHAHECAECNKVFDCQANLDDHLLRHGNGPTIICLQCGKACWTNLSLRLHMKRVHGNDFCGCSICGKAFKNSFLLQTHMRYAHSEGLMKHKCAICGIFFKTSNDLKMHVRFVHSFELPFKCDICTKAFKSKSALNAHKKLHANERLFQCSFCPSNFNSLGQLQDHERRHTDERPYLCTQCPRSFIASTDLISHTRRFHDGTKNYPCLVCGKRFIIQADLTRHSRVHTGEKPYKCKYCGKGSSGVTGNTRHENICKKNPNPPKLPHKCKFCEKRFARSTDKTRHERTHTGEKTKCPFCGKGLTQNSNMTRHTRICPQNPNHHKDFRYKCPHCGKGFNEKSDLTMHTRICPQNPDHHKDLPFKCGYCDKTFAGKPQLTYHENTHTGNNPYKCPYCDKAYPSNVSRNKHQKKCPNRPSTSKDK